ncbi:MAG: DUF2270 domain-containing protein, partial [Roseiflexaceae bacterium]|nr:DUF2270 domain-containing protein [Roseiflexaceae bacterium]
APSVSASIHIYRALMDRATTWRQRIDTSTNWAITTGGATSSFVLSSEIHSHAILLLTTLLMATFLIVEARRTRYYDLWASWVRLLETDYLVGIVRDGQVGLHQPWAQIFVRDLENPRFKVSFWQMLARRLYDNYVALFTFLLLVWLLKLTIHQPADQGLASASIVERAAVGPLPGVAIFGSVLFAYAVMLVFTALAGRHSQSVEVATREALLARLTAPHQQQISRRQSEPSVLAQFHSAQDDIPLETRDWD